MPNRLIHENSPYLLQHAGNPVDWYPYGAEAFATAEKLGRPVIVSIGYAACHWCHVMEHESFSNDTIAEVMNREFICIKVDREERPDVDQLFMSAVQLLHRSGGWPLNCFALPDGRPFWGGTYFRPEQWKDILFQISELFKNNRSELSEQADRIIEGVADMHSVSLPRSNSLNADLIYESYQRLTGQFDMVAGGLAGAPKFPMPGVWEFVMHYYRYTHDESALLQLRTTLNAMEQGGICDQIGGGFARYSTDAAWKVPHFEKMLYDNAQLMALYADMASLTGEKRYGQIATNVLDFVNRELRSDEGLFFTSLDADSNGSEGSFYTWTHQEIETLLPEYAPLIARYYGVGGDGLWENNQNILLRSVPDHVFATREHLSAEELSQLTAMAARVMLAYRGKRPRPATDDKIILSSNALMIKALVHYYQWSGNEQALQQAAQAAEFIYFNFKADHGGYFRIWKEGKARITAFLDDYAFYAEACLALYHSTFDPEWVYRCQELVEYVITNFTDDNTPLFWYSARQPAKGTQAVAKRVQPVTSDAEPSANASMARVLHWLGALLEKEHYTNRAAAMVHYTRDQIMQYPSSYSNWASLACLQIYDQGLVVVTGPEALRNAALLHKKYNPGLMVTASVDGNSLPVFSGRVHAGKNRIYRCRNKVCEPPVSSIIDLVL